MAENDNAPPPAEEESKPLVVDGDAEEVFALIVDVTRMLLGWSWEGTIGITESIEHVAEAYKDVNSDEVE
jgi:hypothetical protein